MFGFQRNFNQPTEITTDGLFWGAARDPKNALLVREGRVALDSGDTKLYDKKKKGLPMIIVTGIFDESEKEVERGPEKTKVKVRGRWRNQQYVRLNGLVVADYDHLEGDVRSVWAEAYTRLTDEDKARIVLVYITPSGRGLKVVFTADIEVGNLIDNQLDFSAKLGLTPDESCKDASRGSFLTSEEDILLIDEKRLFTYEDRAFAEKYEEEYRAGHSAPTKTLSPLTCERAKSPASESLPSRGDSEGSLYHGVPYTKIVEAWLGDEKVEPGDRHRTSLMLADQLRYITDNDPLLIEQILRETPFVKEIIEERNENVSQTVKSAQSYDFYKNIPRRMQEALNKAGVASTDYSASAKQQADGEPQSELSKLFAAKQPPEPPEVLPKLVRVATQSTPRKYLAPVAQAIFPALGSYPKKLGFRYIDNQVRELRMNCLIVAGSGTGKDTCTRQPLARITADMRERDEINRERLKKFNEEYNNKAGNKQKPPRPEGLIIQTIKSDITKAALVQRMDEAQGAPLYVRLNELEQWDKIEGMSGRNNQFTVLKQCDDEDNDFGSDRAGTQSVMASGSLHLNWNANTTTAKVMKYFRNVLTDGPISRLCLATIPDDEIGADIAVFGDYDCAYDEALKPFIDNLKEATGIIDCPQARKLAKRLKEECAEFARLSQDRVFDNLSHRALVAAFRKACLLYVANGKRWERAIETFCRWSLFYDLYLKMHLWGDQIRHADDDISTSKRGPQSLLELLPDEFTLEDAKRVRQQRGLSNEGFNAIKMIRTWVNRKYVIQNTEYSFQKSPKYRTPYGL